MPARRIIVAPAALRELREVWAYYAREANPDVADRMIDGLRAAFDTLADTPGIGHTRPDVRDPRYRFWRVKSHIIAYRFSRNRLYVGRVVHGHRDFRRIFRGGRGA